MGGGEDELGPLEDETRRTQSWEDRSGQIRTATIKSPYK